MRNDNFIQIKSVTVKIHQNDGSLTFYLGNIFLL